MSLIDKSIFELKTLGGCKESEYQLCETRCCGHFGILDDELLDFYYDPNDLSRFVFSGKNASCPFCSKKLEFEEIDDVTRMPAIWTWAMPIEYVGMYNRAKDPVSQAQWTSVDDYLSGLFIPPDPALDSALADSTAAGLPAIAVSPPQGKMLHLLAQAIGARNILELGTLGGYSTIWLARALPANGKLITLEFEPKHAAIAQKNINRAGLEKIVEIKIGNALEILPRLVDEKNGPFDLIFIDADKENYPSYLEWVLKLSRPGTMIIADNVVRNGAVIDLNDPDIRVQGARKFNELVAADPRVTATAIQTVGAKGYDGFALITVLK